MGQEASKTIHVGAHNIDKEINKNGRSGSGSGSVGGGGLAGGSGTNRT